MQVGDGNAISISAAMKGIVALTHRASDLPSFSSSAGQVSGGALEIAYTSTITMHHHHLVPEAVVTRVPGLHIIMLVL